MKEKKLFIYLIGLLFLLNLASAAVYEGEIPVKTGEGDIIIGEGEQSCSPYWISFWSDCINGQQTYICYDQNNCDTTLGMPEECGNIRECNASEEDEAYCGDDNCNEEAGENCANCPDDCGKCSITNKGGSSSSGGGSSSSSGGGSSSGSGSVTTTSGSSSEIISSTLKWDCGEWNECVEGKQTRTCTEANGNANNKTETRICDLEKAQEDTKKDEEGWFENLGASITGAFTQAGMLTSSGISVALIILYAILIIVLVVAVKKYTAK